MAHRGGWITVDQAKELCEEKNGLTHYSSGYVIDTKNGGLSIVQSFNHAEVNVDNLFTIPWVAVVNIVVDDCPFEREERR